VHFGKGLNQLLVISLGVFLLVLVQPDVGQAASSHTSGSADDMPQNMTMDRGDQEQGMPETSDVHEEQGMPGMAQEPHGQDMPGEKEGHGEDVDNGVNWPVIFSFAGINGAALLSAAVLRRKRLKTIAEGK